MPACSAAVMSAALCSITSVSLDVATVACASHGLPQDHFVPPPRARSVVRASPSARIISAASS
jgi:hypothetical protein